MAESERTMTTTKGYEVLAFGYAGYTYAVYETFHEAMLVARQLRDRWNFKPENIGIRILGSQEQEFDV